MDAEMQQKCDDIIKKMYNAYHITGTKEKDGQICKNAYTDYQAGKLTKECYNSIYYHAVTIGTNR